MNAGQAITHAMKAQRIIDIYRIWNALTGDQRHAIYAYWCWGWDINGSSGLGHPGSDK